MVNMDLTDSEVKLVLNSRQEQLRYKTRAEKIRNCVHEFKYIGSGHNDDCYECTKCSETEWR